MKKIMFNDKFGLTDAVLNGQKTMTRRIVKFPKDIDPDKIFSYDWGCDDAGRQLITFRDRDFKELCTIYPHYQFGERVAIAQRYSVIPVDSLPNAFMIDALKEQEGWHNKMYVRADLMPHRVGIINVGVERLQDISDVDCFKEGICAHTVELDETPGVHPYTSYAFDARVGSNIPRWWYSTPRKAYAVLIDKVSGRGTWKNNPYVFYYELKLIK